LSNRSRRTTASPANFRCRFERLTSASELAFIENRRHPHRMTIGHYGPTTEETKRAIKRMNEWAAQFESKPEEARKFLVKHGFITKTGKLAKRYR